MSKAYIVADNMVCSLGTTSDEIISSLQKSESGIKICDDKSIYPSPFQASLIQREKIKTLINQNVENTEEYTRLEQIFIYSAIKALKKTKVDVKSSDTLFVFSTTKGNIDLLAKNYSGTIDQSRVYLHKMAKAVTQYFGNKNNPIVVSNACISGVLAVNLAKDLINSGKYKNIVICGGDIATEFVISGFQSFKAISEQPCRPYDKKRDGITIGEAVATIILSSSPANSSKNIFVAGGGSSNDANHISGPSRSGDGLMLACKKVIDEANINISEIDFVSAHGTATAYNDEMESKAFNWLGVQNVPLNSFKGYWGHTLGAAGIIEIIASTYSMRNNELYKSAGFEELGTPKPLNVIKNYEKKIVNTVLKTASGFGGCNGATLLRSE